MKDFWNVKDFCADLTSEILSEEELSQICRRTVRRARQRRVAGQLRVVALLALLGVVTWLAVKPPTAELAQVPVSKPERAFALVRTETFSDVIRTEPAGAGPEFFAAMEPVPTLSSPSPPAYIEVSDEQLLRFFEGRAVALVKLPGGRAELELFAAEGEESFGIGN